MIGHQKIIFNVDLRIIYRNIYLSLMQLVETLNRPDEYIFCTNIYIVGLLEDTLICGDCHM